jgi:hypothetical protein
MIGTRRIAWMLPALAAFLAVGHAAPAPRARACIHPGGHGGGTTSRRIDLEQKAQEALIIKDGDVEHLVLKVSFDASADLPSLGWVIPVPSAPSAYATVDGGVFPALDRWVKMRRIVPSPSLRSRGARGNGHGGGGSQAVPLRMLPVAQAGPYAIQPIQTVGEAGVEALREWMRTNDFAPIPEPALRYYAERSWTFLATKVRPPGAGGTLGREADLPPLRVTFRSERIVYPLKLEAQGVFPVRAFVITRQPLTNAELDGVRERGFEVAGDTSGNGYLRPRNVHERGELAVSVRRFAIDGAPAPLAALLREIAPETAGAEMHLRVLYAARFGEEEADPGRWPEDLGIPGLPAFVRAETPTAVPVPTTSPSPSPSPTTTTTTTTSTPTPTPTPTTGAPASAAGGDEGSCAVGGLGAGGPVGLVLVLLSLRRRGRRRSPSGSPG